MGGFEIEATAKVDRYHISYGRSHGCLIVGARLLPLDEGPREVAFISL
jgi:hypothetical protein